MNHWDLDPKYLSGAWGALAAWLRDRRRRQRRRGLASVLRLLG